ncbi:MAG: transposase, partial [Nitrospira sp.]|nr:transposase [Nitrospira sp.]
MAGAVAVLPYTANDGRRRERAGRVRQQVTQNASEESIGAFVRANVETGSRFRTDGWRGYFDTALTGYPHLVRVIGSPTQGHQSAPH